MNRSPIAVQALMHLLVLTGVADISATNLPQKEPYGVGSNRKSSTPVQLFLPNLKSF